MLSKVFHGIKWSWETALKLSELIECENCGKCCKNVRLDNGVLAKGLCRHRSNGGCDIYNSRPIRCRVYPIAPYPDDETAEIMIHLCPAGKKLAEELENGNRLHRKDD